ncbi:hypothetical protein A7K72_06130, partial [Candidatus Methylacidiphilum fumarolicum]|uniref:zinc ribbon domain-containing protein n=1 Tax=Candidatus Methylacidiphilum fumarolicum TaxID=591154 RepID=UPI00106C608F
MFFAFFFVGNATGGTSSRCPECGHRHKPNGRNWRCPKCGFQGHRDEQPAA